jgi:hypothetical protein
MRARPGTSSRVSEGSSRSHYRSHCPGRGVASANCGQRNPAIEGSPHHLVRSALPVIRRRTFATFREGMGIFLGSEGRAPFYNASVAGRRATSPTIDRSLCSKATATVRITLPIAAHSALLWPVAVLHPQMAKCQCQSSAHSWRHRGSLRSVDSRRNTIEATVALRMWQDGSKPSIDAPARRFIRCTAASMGRSSNIILANSASPACLCQSLCIAQIIPVTVFSSTPWRIYA